MALNDKEKVSFDKEIKSQGDKSPNIEQNLPQTKDSIKIPSAPLFLDLIGLSDSENE